MQKSRSIKLLANLSLGLFLAGCAGAPSSLAPASTSAVLITDLMKIVFGVAAVVFVIVEGLILYSVFKYRHKDDGVLLKKNLPKQIEGNQFLETAWTLAPAIVLAIIFVIGAIGLQTVLTLPGAGSNAAPNSPADTSSVRVRVVGHQYWWQFEYPDLKFVTANEMHVPVTTDVTAAVESMDVIHSFWVPQMGGKIDVIPGRTNYTWFNATKEGTYVGQCAELCGTAHANMRMILVVESAEKYQAWVKQQQSPPARTIGNATSGENVFFNGTCVGCHSIRETRARGQIGPDLTHFASRSIFSGGVLSNTPENLTKWLENPPAIKPGSVMPKLGLTPEQINALVIYLENLK